MALMFLQRALHHLVPRLSKLRAPLRDMLACNWHLGFTSFGGPAVHFQIRFHNMFVEKYEWIDEQMYQEMFALCQALPGPASTKMLYTINTIRGGFVAGVLSFAVWSLPGAVSAYALAVGVSRIGDRLPAPVYALLSGLNSATVGLIALAAVQLSEKAVTDKTTRVLVFLSGAAGMLYSALWYYPLLVMAGGCVTLIWDYRWGHRVVGATRALIFHSVNSPRNGEEERGAAVELRDVSTPQVVSDKNLQDAAASRRTASTTMRQGHPTIIEDAAAQQIENSEARIVPPNPKFHIFSWRLGVIVIASFFTTFVAFMTLRGTLHDPPRGFGVFANLYLAGTIIFGGGPVVIPLLREYVVNVGWVSARDFLLGLAIIQAFPGPKFNFAVYLGTLAVAGPVGLNPAAGAAIGYVAIFAPGLILHTGAIGLWRALRSRRWVASCLRGVNATAVGLIYTAVYRLWEIGFVGPSFGSGAPLGNDPWWVVATATSFVGGRWFGLPAPVAILLGGVMGMVWYAVVTR